MSCLHYRIDERVRIVVSRLAILEAAVTHLVPGAAELTLLARPSVPARFLHRQRAVVTSQTVTDGIEGMLLAVPNTNGRVREDRLHFLEAVLPMVSSQRREFARVKAIRPVTLVPEGFKLGWLNGQTRDLSGGGLLIAGAHPLNEGDRARVRLELDVDRDELDILDMVGRVVRADDEHGLRGLTLERMDERTRQRIVRFVFEQQRRALAELRAHSA